MYAVVRTGGKQYKVTKGAILTVESLAGDVGSKLTLGERVLLAGWRFIALAKLGMRRWSRALQSNAKSWNMARAKKSWPSRKSAARTPTASAVIASISPS